MKTTPTKGPPPVNTAIDFAQFLLSFVPFIALVALALVAFWVILKMSPGFAERVNATYERMMGVDEEYDRKYNTGYAETTPRRWY